MNTDDKPHLQKWPNGSGFLYKHHGVSTPASQALLLASCVEAIDRHVTGQVVWRCCRCNYDTWNNEDHLLCRDCDYEPCDDCYFRNRVNGQRKYRRLEEFRKNLYEDPNSKEVVPPVETPIKLGSAGERENTDDTRVGNEVERQREAGPRGGNALTQKEPELSKESTSKAEARRVQRAVPQRDITSPLSPRRSGKIDDREIALRLFQEHVDHEIQKREEFEMMRKVYWFDEEKLLNTGVVTDEPTLPNNLICDVHPLFAYHHWTDCRREVWEWMAPALRTASMFLTDPQWVGFWVQLFKGSRTKCIRPGAPDDPAYFTWYSRFDPEDTGSAGMVIEKLRELGEDWTWANWSWNKLPTGDQLDGYANELRDDVVEATGHLMCRRLVASSGEPSDDSNLFPVEFEKGFDDKWTAKSEQSRVHIKLQNGFLHFIEHAMIASDITQNQILCFNLHFASVLLHNLAHAVEQHLTSEYYSSRSLIRNQEPAMNDPQIAECGDTYMQLIFTGAIEPVHDISDYTGGLCVIDLSSFQRNADDEGVHEMWAMPMGHVALYQQQRFWATYPNHELLPGCMSARRWPKALKARYVPPFQPGEVFEGEKLDEYQAETDGEEANWIDSRDDAVMQMNTTVREAFTKPLKDDPAGPPPINSRTFPTFTSDERERLRSIVKPHWDASIRGMLAIELAITRRPQEIYFGGARVRGRPVESRREMQSLLKLIAHKCATHFRDLVVDSANVIVRARKVKHFDFIKSLGQATATHDGTILNGLAPNIGDILRRMTNAIERASLLRLTSVHGVYESLEHNVPHFIAAISQSIEGSQKQSNSSPESIDEGHSPSKEPGSSSVLHRYIDSDTEMDLDAQIELSGSFRQISSANKSPDSIGSSPTTAAPKTPPASTARSSTVILEEDKEPRYLGIASALSGFLPSYMKKHKDSQVNDSGIFPPYIPDSESSDQGSVVNGESPFEEDLFVDSEHERPRWVPAEES